VKLTKTKPIQIIIRLHACTILLFRYGQFRIMGHVNFNVVKFLTNILQPIYKCIQIPISYVSETVVFQLDKCLIPVNLYHMNFAFKNDYNIQFEPELFPALTIHYWKPIHVNLFSSGKVIVLGKDAMTKCTEIYEWLFLNLLLL